MRLYIGNVNFDADEEMITALVEAYGYVKDCWLPKDPITRRPRGYCFVDVPDDQKALEAIKGLDQTVFMGRTIRCSEARPRKEIDDDRQ